MKSFRTAIVGIAVVLLLPAWPSQAAWVDFSANLMAFAEKRWGREAPLRLKIVQRLVRDNQAAFGKGQTELVTLRTVNGFWNQVPYFTDKQHWGLDDYWATPVEMLGTFGGDCEDYVIGKYMSLKQVGVPIEKMRITYVRAIRLGESHMVLAYYPTPDADPLILDNLIGDIRSASQRTDLEPVYSFNDDDLWIVNGATRRGGASDVRLWRELVQKMQKEEQM